MKAIITKKTECFPTELFRESLSDNLFDFKEIVTTVYFIGIPIFCAVKKLGNNKPKKKFNVFFKAWRLVNFESFVIGLLIMSDWIFTLRMMRGVFLFRVVRRSSISGVPLKCPVNFEKFAVTIS